MEEKFSLPLLSLIFVEGWKTGASPPPPPLPPPLPFLSRFPVLLFPLSKCEKHGKEGGRRGEERSNDTLQECDIRQFCKWLAIFHIKTDIIFAQLRISTNNVFHSLTIGGFHPKHISVPPSSFLSMPWMLTHLVPPSRDGGMGSFSPSLLGTVCVCLPWLLFAPPSPLRRRMQPEQRERKSPDASL